MGGIVVNAWMLGSGRGIFEKVFNDKKSDDR